MASALLWASSNISSSSFNPRRAAKGRDAIYVAAAALRAPRGPAQMLASMAYSVGAWDLQHFMVIIKPSSSHPQVFVYDFQPKDPDNNFVAFLALLGGYVPGVVLKRTMKRMPRLNCWFVGYSNANDSVQVADKFNENWSTNLIVGKHDCRHYTNGWGLERRVRGKRNRKYVTVARVEAAEQRLS
ncbi:hypothetical protein AXF42_Ash002705 [Apostasia shenzhenica]|uniref:Uncharacterized protein n=1 Tax=Apostasia shenzhenica TaxID=1088818 RepID=A0A2I0A723_9ASPA|nr:hypothetical protein AXF42_Ash002705 [Apostasia shenzhenica]